MLGNLSTLAKYDELLSFIDLDSTQNICCSESVINLVGVKCLIRSIVIKTKVIMTGE